VSYAVMHYYIYIYIYTKWRTSKTEKSKKRFKLSLTSLSSQTHTARHFLGSRPVPFSLALTPTHGKLIQGQRLRHVRRRFRRRRSALQFRRLLRGRESPRLPRPSHLRSKGIFHFSLLPFSFNFLFQLLFFLLICRFHLFFSFGIL